MQTHCDVVSFHLSLPSESYTAAPALCWCNWYSAKGAVDVGFPQPRRLTGQPLELLHCADYLIKSLVAELFRN